MKQFTNSATLKNFFALFMLCLFQVVLLAQDSGSTSSSTTKTDVKITSETSDTWYTQPWVWIVGAAVLILLLVALLRGGGGSDRGTTASRTDKVTVTKSTSADTDL
jgi:amino acid transporter